MTKRDMNEHNKNIALKRRAEVERKYKGKRLQFLTILGLSGETKKYDGVLIDARCDCGEIVTGQSMNRIVSGRIKSCVKCTNVRRGKSQRVDNPVHKERLHRIWSNIKTRCNNQNSKRYKDYGGRGIKIYSNWESSYHSFKEWALASGYKDNLSIDRIDNDKSYYPLNCRWATPREQTLNSRIRSDNKTGERCVSILRGKYQVSIDGKYIGVFKTVEEAVTVRDKCLLKMDKRIL